MSCAVSSNTEIHRRFHCCQCNFRYTMVLRYRMSKYDRFFLIQRIRKVNQWEKINLPIYGTRAGYELFLQLAELPAHAQKPLKEIYLSMNCAESTTRLLLRNLETDGWITLPRLGMDERFKGFRLTDKFLNRIDEWLKIHYIRPDGTDEAEK